MISTIHDVLDAHTQFVITTHVRPDGDAIGSQIALAQYLTKRGKEVAMINSDPAPSNLGWLPGSENIETYRGGARQIKKIAGADVIIVVDTNAAHRLGEVGEVVKNSTAQKILIDHHTQPESWFDHTLVNDRASSTGELIFDLITETDKNLLDKSISTALYVAILTDTGSFRFSSVTAHVHTIVAQLLEKGVEPAEVYGLLYESKSIHALRLLGRALDTIRILPDGKIGYLTVTIAMLQETGATSEDTEGLVTYVQALEGVEVALIFTEVSNGTKVSFRSKGEWHVHKWARSLGGGGHRNASGAFLKLPLQKAIRTTLESASQFLPLSIEDASETPSAEDEAYLLLLQASREE